MIYVFMNLTPHTKMLPNTDLFAILSPSLIWKAEIIIYECHKAPQHLLHIISQAAAAAAASQFCAQLCT